MFNRSYITYHYHLYSSGVYHKALGCLKYSLSMPCDSSIVISWQTSSIVDSGNKFYEIQAHLNYWLCCIEIFRSETLSTSTHICLLRLWNYAFMTNFISSLIPSWVDMQKLSTTSTKTPTFHLSIVTSFLCITSICGPLFSQ